MVLTGRQDLKTAMRNRDMKTLNPLKALITAHQASSKEILNKKPQTPSSKFETDSFLAPVIHKQIAKRQDSIAGFKEYHRHDLVEKEAQEIAVLSKYLPQPQTTAEEVRAMTIEATEQMRSEGVGENDPGSMNIKQIHDWLRRDEGRREKLSPIMADQAMVKRVVAETVRDLSDRIDAAPSIEVEMLNRKEEDPLTKDRYL